MIDLTIISVQYPNHYTNPSPSLSFFLVLCYFLVGSIPFIRYFIIT